MPFLWFGSYFQGSLVSDKGINKEAVAFRKVLRKKNDAEGQARAGVAREMTIWGTGYLSRPISIIS